VQRRGQRVLRMAKGESTKRSEMDAEHLTAHLQQAGVRQMGQSEEQDMWVIADSSDLCTPDAQELPSLLNVLAGQEQVVSGSRTLTVIGRTPRSRGMLSPQARRSEEPGVLSEPAEVQTMLETVSEALADL